MPHAVIISLLRRWTHHLMHRHLHYHNSGPPVITILFGFFAVIYCIANTGIVISFQLMTITIWCKIIIIQLDWYHIWLQCTAWWWKLEVVCIETCKGNPVIGSAWFSNIFLNLTIKFSDQVVNDVGEQWVTFCVWWILPQYSMAKVENYRCTIEETCEIIINDTACKQLHIHRLEVDWTPVNVDCYPWP